MTVPSTFAKAPAFVAPNWILLDAAGCPECGRVADVVDRFVLASTDGPVEHIRLRCDAGRHHLTIIVEKDYAMTTTDTTPAKAVAAPYEELAALSRGRVILPADSDYDVARAVYNAMIDRRPAALLCCRDVADVIAGVRFATAHGIAVAVRGGGHNAAGLG
ncbi:MAG: FAD-binding protein, partial [Sciscionella sp.]